MPLQKEYHKETQCYYLTCFLLPQIYTSGSTPTNTASKATAQETTYDYYATSTVDDESQQNIHLAALENLSLASISVNRSNNTAMMNKRKICFASDPPQEITPINQTGRLIRSPTPYPKELRMMAKFANKNLVQQPQKHHAQQKSNSTKNLDEMGNLNQLTNTKLLNTVNNVLFNETDLNGINKNLDVGANQHEQSLFNDFNKSQNKILKTPFLNGDALTKNTNIAIDMLDGNLNESINENQNDLQQYNPSSNYLMHNTTAYNIVQSSQQPTMNTYYDLQNNRLNPHKNSSTYDIPNDQLVQYESFNGEQNRKFAPSMDENASIYSSSKRASQASSINSTNADEHNLHDMSKASNSYRLSSSTNYTENSSPRQNNENDPIQTHFNLIEPINNEQNHNNIMINDEKRLNTNLNINQTETDSQINQVCQIFKFFSSFYSLSAFF